MENLPHIILNFVILVGMAYLIFFKDYLKKKGSNLADKEDISELTKQIETVKSKFLKENEYLKAELQLIISNQLQQSNEERNAITFFFDEWSKWTNIGLLDIPFNEYNRVGIDKLIEKKRQLNEFYVQTSIAQSRITLLVVDEELITLSHKLVSETLSFTHWIQSFLLELQFNLEKDKRGFDMFMILKDIKPLPLEARELEREEQELIEARKKLSSDYYGTKIDEFKKVMVIKHQFTDRVKSYLTKIQAK